MSATSFLYIYAFMRKTVTKGLTNTYVYGILFSVYIKEVMILMDHSLSFGSTGMLLLKLLEESDMYGYQMIQTLRSRSDHTFELKAGSLYPLLHTMEEQGLISAYMEDISLTRPRRYYHLTSMGRKRLAEQRAAWSQYMGAVERVLKGDVSLA